MTLSRVVICKICGNEYKQIHPNHLRKHGITLQKYKQQYLNEPTMSDYLINLRRNLRLKDWEDSKYRERMLRLMHSPDRLEKITRTLCPIMLKKWEDPEYRKNTLAVLHSPEARRRQLEAIKTPRYKANMRTKLRQACSTLEARNRLARTRGLASIRPTKPELIFTAIIVEYNPPFKYVGDGSFLIGSKNPDFIDTLGSKKAVEIFGNYWHTENDEERRKLEFAKLGWDCLVIWEKELGALPPKLIVQRVLDFLLRVDRNA